MRGCGILLHISSLPGPGGIGCLGGEAHRFADFLKAAGQSHWQVLPLTPPARGNSPYSSYSVFAGNPLLIDLEELMADSLLSAEDIAALPRENTGAVDFAACERAKTKLLRKAYANTGGKRYAKLEKFKEENAYWLDDYTLFMALKTKYRGKPYYKWDADIVARRPKALAAAREELAAEIGFRTFCQYLFDAQWYRLKRHANKNGVKIIGDMPIYADEDSADCWSNPRAFQLGGDFRPAAVAGVPPDAFTDKGQRWGNPLYNWSYLKRTGYGWWLNRMRRAAALYDVVRIDHFRALDAYWSVPKTARTAKSGSWRRGPGIAFLDAVKAAQPRLSLIAEDLGMLTPSVHRLREAAKLPGMKILLFAFDPGEESSYLPHNLPRDCVAYIGTHDNDTALGWLQTAHEDCVTFAANYLRLSLRDPAWGFIRGLYMSVAELAVVQMQDALGLDNTARMNVPGKALGNWGWRMRDGAASARLAKKLRMLAALYGRTPKIMEQGAADET